MMTDVPLQQRVSEDVSMNSVEQETKRKAAEIQPLAEPSVTKKQAG